MYSRGCVGGIDVEVLSDLLMRSTTVLATVEKAGGYRVEPPLVGSKMVLRD